MSRTTERVFEEDSYLSTMETEVTAHEGDDAISVARSNLYAAGGGQPGDTGFIELVNGTQLPVRDTVKSADGRSLLLHLDGVRPAVGSTIVLHVDWARRYKLMRMHTALHLLTVVCPYPVTGAAVGEEEGRIDFDLAEAEVDRDAITRDLMALVATNHPVGTRWITEDELDRNPGLVKSANVRPPRGMGRVRLVTIGSDGEIDSQPCGGTHVGETSEVGDIHLAKVEKKGRANRRFRLRFGPSPQ